MPIKRTAWACEFKCGYRVETQRGRMVAHEERCFYNPKRRACQTCVHKQGPFEDEPAYCEKLEDRDLEKSLFNECEGWEAKP